MSEVKENNENPTETLKKQVHMNSKNEILTALRSKFATSVNRVYINSIGEEVGFREVTVAEQKSYSRIMIDNEYRKDILYDAQCALINKTCLNDQFDIYKLTEFDKIKLSLAMYQSNVTKNEITFTCSECGTDNKYKLDFKNAMSYLDSFDIGDKTFEMTVRNNRYSFTVGYPKVTKISEFYKNIVRKYKKNLYESSTETQINIEYMLTFVKNVVITDSDGESMSIDMTDMSSEDITEIIEEFPQEIMYSEDGLLKFITHDMVETINECFETHKCLQCGHVQSDDIRTTSDFFS